MEQPWAKPRGWPYKTFLIYQHPNFMGIKGPMRVDNWLVDLDQTFKIYECMEDQKVLYTKYLLQGEASIW